jgi:hypothetical protein
MNLSKYYLIPIEKESSISAILEPLNVVSKNVSSKRLHNEIHDLIYNVIISFRIRWTNKLHRNSFVHAVDEFLIRLQKSNKITQYKVICDTRNNKNGFINSKEIIFEVYYKQLHCLNMTSITFHIPVIT